VIRLTDLPSDQAKCLAELECQDVETRPWVTGPALSIPPAVKQLQQFPTFSPSGTTDVPDDTVIKVGLAKPSH